MKNPTKKFSVVLMIICSLFFLQTWTSCVTHVDTQPNNPVAPEQPGTETGGNTGTDSGNQTETGGNTGTDSGNENGENTDNDSGDDEEIVLGAEPASLPSITIPSDAKIIFNAATSVNTIGGKTWGDTVLSDATVAGKTVKKVSVTSGMTNKVGVYAITNQTWASGSKMYLEVYSNADIQVAAKGGEGNDRFSDFKTNGAYNWRTFEIDLNTYGFTSSDNMVFGSNTEQTYYVAAVYIVEPSQQGGTTGGETNPPSTDPDPIEPAEIDWSKIDWIGDGAGGYVNKYKIKDIDNSGANIVNIQKKDDFIGIYMNGLGTSFNISMSDYKAVVDMLFIGLSTFVEGENYFTINGKRFCVFYKAAGGSSSGNGGSTGGDSNQLPQKPETPPESESGATVTGFTLTGPTTVKETNQITLKGVFSYSDGTTTEVPGMDIVWTSSNTDIALAAAKGIITGMSQGTATITAKYGKDYSATFNVEVVADIDPESLIKTEADIVNKKDYSLITPFGDTEPSISNGRISFALGNAGEGYTYVAFVKNLADQSVFKVKAGSPDISTTVPSGGTYEFSIYCVKDGKYSGNKLVKNVTVPNFDIVQKELPSDARARLADYSPNGTRKLVQKKDNTVLTLQFENNSGYPDSQVWVTGYGMNENHEWCYLSPSGIAIPMDPGTDSYLWSFTLDQISSTYGLQVKTFESGRIYFTVGEKPVYMFSHANGGGLAQPNLAAIEGDVNEDRMFDWVEFTCAPGNVYINTTQVDAFTFPIVVADYTLDGRGGYEWTKSVGITKSRQEVFDAWNNWVKKYTEFTSCNRGGKRILAPCKVTEFKVNHGNYMDEYINDIWEYYKTNELHYFENEHGGYTGRVNDEGVFCFTQDGTGNKYYIYRKPTIEEAWEGSGVLADPGNAESCMNTLGNSKYIAHDDVTNKAIQNRICSALTRHSLVKENGNYVWKNDDIDCYYQNTPANMYSAFFHTTEAGSIDHKAYGYCYDDNHDQSTTNQVSNPWGCVIGIGNCK